MTDAPAGSSVAEGDLEPVGAGELVLGWAVLFLTTLGPVYTARFHAEF